MSEFSLSIYFLTWGNKWSKNEKVSHGSCHYQSLAYCSSLGALSCPSGGKGQRETRLQNFEPRPSLQTLPTTSFTSSAPGLSPLSPEEARRPRKLLGTGWVSAQRHRNECAKSEKQALEKESAGTRAPFVRANITFKCLLCYAVYCVLGWFSFQVSRSETVFFTRCTFSFLAGGCNSIAFRSLLLDK